MKILLTGQPGVGKSTIINKVRTEGLEAKLHGIVTHEIRGEDGARVGFEMENLRGERRLLAHKTAIESEARIAAYHVDIQAIEEFLIPEMIQAMENTDSVLILDEIGRMQALSATFLKVLAELFHSKANVLATIVQDPEPWSLQYKQDQGNLIFTADRDLQEKIVETIVQIFRKKDVLAKLTPELRQGIIDMAREYEARKQIVQLQKVFENTIYYLVEGSWKIVQDEADKRVVEIAGKHNLNTVEIDLLQGKTSCSCDLFNGRNYYVGRAGECSHLQTVKLLQLDTKKTV